ncbi:histone-lysine N-methyltransferase SETDB1-A-like isoform X2 [Sander lucioperca]|uniref:histone-lysine N-methyltransferase SETDB1-A-like isoform X2 n=1 Tax=Sander lucioperca TaxID=283035 RepID=UPI0016537883|nr:histone-lysine N-methyltransferase SETDB1-A-like isoform X2 [Sander lucioperca]
MPSRKTCWSSVGKQGAAVSSRLGAAALETKKKKTPHSKSSLHKVIMEGDEIEMSEEELQKWIRGKVKKNKLISSDVLEKCKLLQSLLERREKQAAHFLKLCESVSACEAIVRKQYSLLGWEYRDTDSDEDDNTTGSGNAIPSPIPLLPKLQAKGNLQRENGKKSSISLKRKPVVVLTRLSMSQISSLRPPTPQNHNSKDESLNNSESDGQWEPLESSSESSDSDFSISSNKTWSSKRRKKDQRNSKLTRSHTTPQASTSTDAKSNVAKPSTPQASTSTDAKSNVAKPSTPQASTSTDAKSNVAKPSTPQASTSTDAKSNVAKPSTPQASTSTDAKSNVAKPSTPQASTSTDAKSNVAKPSTPQASTSTDAKSNVAKPSTPQASTNTDAKSNATKPSTVQASANTDAKSNVTKTSTMPANSKVTHPMCIVTDSKTPPSVSQGELKVNMNVLARRKVMSWQQGKILEIVTKDGRMKYKINFEEKKKTLFSGHHIAFDYMPKVEQLFIGARVVVKSQDRECRFCPGVLAELPSRKNRMRFLVFMDDHTPVYVGLPLLHLVCRPLTDPLDDIPDGTHKNFIKQYLKAWPYPPQTQYRIGQAVNAEFNGIVQKCEVQAIDSSLIQVVVETDQHKEWIYRGSTCLEHMKGLLESKKKDEQKNTSSTVNSKSNSTT